jgi:hypothetical protein
MPPPRWPIPHSISRCHRDTHVKDEENVVRPLPVMQSTSPTHWHLLRQSILSCGNSFETFYAMIPSSQSRNTVMQTPNITRIGVSLVNCVETSLIEAYSATCRLRCSTVNKTFTPSNNGITNANQRSTMQSVQSAPFVNSPQHPLLSRHRNFMIRGVKSTLKKRGHSSAHVASIIPSRSDLTSNSSTNSRNPASVTKLKLT